MGYRSCNRFSHWTGADDLSFLHRHCGVDRLLCQKKGAAIYCGDALFLLRQFSSKIRTLRFTMGTLTALFTLAILGSSVAFMFNHFQNEVLVSKFPFDVQVYSSNVKDEFQQEITLLKQETAIKEIFTYKVYENETNQVNAYLYTHLKEFGSEYRNADGTPDWKKISKMKNWHIVITIPIWDSRITTGSVP